jgi:outer membrane autotransporter protein
VGDRDVARGGYPFRFGRGWVVEPQIRLVYQSLSLDDTHDEAATVNFDRAESLAGRVGGGWRAPGGWASRSSRGRSRRGRG